MLREGKGKRRQVEQGNKLYLPLSYNLDKAYLTHVDFFPHSVDEGPVLVRRFHQDVFAKC